MDEPSGWGGCLLALGIAIGAWTIIGLAVLAVASLLGFVDPTHLVR